MVTITEQRLAQINRIREGVGKAPLTRETIMAYLQSSSNETLTEEALDDILKSLEILLENS